MVAYCDDLYYLDTSWACFFMKDDKWLVIDTGYAYGAVLISNGKVTDCADIFRKWAIGLTEEVLRKRVKVVDEFTD